ncbi:glycosyltransferase family 39 protein [Myxococcota bacterium]|nr:glycosyltransferase family 39 protein [Myxococcota bacterium]
MPRSESDVDVAPGPTERRALLGLIALAVVLRVAYLFEYATLPFWDGPLYDALVYLRQAEAVADGRHGDASLLAMSPLYGYFIAALGRAPVVVAVVQSAMGVATLVLAWRLARRYVPAPFGLVAPLALMGYGVVQFYESKLLSESLGLFLATTTLVVAEAARRRPAGGGRLLFLAGAVFGCAVLARASLLLLVPFVLLAEIPAADSLRVGLRRALLTGAGLFGVLAAHGGWTYAYTGHFVPVIFASSTAATTTHRTWDGNLPASDGSDRRASAFDVVAQAEARLAGEVSPARFNGLDPIGLVTGAPPKLARLFSDLERGFDYPYYGERSLSKSLAVLPLSFGTLLVAGLVGLYARWHRGLGRTLWPLLAFVVGVVALVVVFHPSTRYRLPLVVPLAVLSADAVAFLAGLAPRARALGFGVLGLATLVFSARLYTYTPARPGGLDRILATACRQAGDPICEAHHTARATRLEAGAPSP